MSTAPPSARSRLPVRPDRARSARCAACRARRASSRPADPRGRLVLVAFVLLVCAGDAR